MKNDLFSLANRNVVITGGAGLLGMKHADAVIASGGRAILLDRDIERLNLAVKALQKTGHDQVIAYECDITDENSVDYINKLLIESFGHIDALINNAANNPPPTSDGLNLQRLESFSINQWNADLAVGLTGAMICSKYFGRSIASNSRGGVILNISSDLGLIGPDQRLYSSPNIADNRRAVKPITYSVVKAGLIGMTKYLATYWPEKVRCNALCPGGVGAGQSPEFVEELIKRIPMNRMAKPDEYQGAIIFMLSDASSYMNGAILSVDGGRTAW